MTEEFHGPSRGLFVDAGNTPGFFNVFNGSSGNFEVGQFNNSGNGSGITDRTPAGFVPDANNLWQIDSFFNSNGGGFTAIIAHPGKNIADIANTVPSTVYTGNINTTGALTPALNDPGGTEFQVSGGIIALHPYLVAYGSDGVVAWSAINDPTKFPVANAANPVSSKIVKGLSIRGGQQAPAALLWSLDSLILMSFVGGSAIWDFDNISDQSSILSSSCVVEMDGVYYWPGVDRFLTYNGVVRELPNEMNLDFFYTNLNFSQRQKCFGFKMPRWGEIWFCAPLFGATECNWAIIYNVRENTWYDTPLPADGRSAAYFTQSWWYPIMASANGLVPIGQNTGLTFPLFQHEFGTDFIRGNVADAIPSHFVSPSASIVGGGLSLLGGPAGASDSVFTEMVFFEPDFTYGKFLSITTLGRMYAQDTDSVLNDVSILNPANLQPGGRNLIDLQQQARYLRWKIGSNVGGGSYVMGSPLLYYRPGDKQP